MAIADSRFIETERMKSKIVRVFFSISTFTTMIAL